VFAVFGVNEGIFTNFGALEAMAAGWLLLAIVDIVWLLYFTSEENSLTLHVFNMLGNGGLTGPGRNGFRPGGRRTTNAHTMQNGIGSGYGGGGIGSADYASANPPMSGGFGGGVVGGYDVKETGMGGLEAARTGSQRSLGNPVTSVHSAGSGPRNPMSATSPPTSATQPLVSSNVDGPSQNTPLMDSSNASAPEGDEYRYRAKALYACE